MPSSDASETAPRRKSTGMHDSKVMIGRFEIDTTRILRDFEHEYADAFECISVDTGLNDHVAVIIKGRHPVRRDVVDACINNDVPSVISLKTAQVVDWHDGTRRYALIYRRPAGNAILQKHVQHREPLAEDALRHAVIRPLYHALQAFADRRIFHGNVRPQNIFLTNPENPEALLGEFASSVPGINQPVMYETIERAMADPRGKGVGHIHDDIYALGVSVAVLLHGRNPLEGRTPQIIVEEKINRGSYALLIDGLRVSPGFSELLRGLLNDDPVQRWTIEQLGAWVSGTRTTPKSPILPVKAQRAIDFNGKKYVRSKLLARDLITDLPEAVALIESGNLGKWLERAIGDPKTLNAFNAAVSRADSARHGQDYNDKLVCMVCMALDPEGPIRFRDLCVFPTGIGYMLAFAMAEEKPVQNIAEFLRERYVWLWFNQKDHPPGVHERIQLIEQASKMLTRRGINQGLERCLYEICQDAPCLSGFFTDHYVVDGPSLLHALDDVAEKNKDRRPIDRHIASFIMVRDSRDKAMVFGLIEGSDSIRGALGLITLYQQMQKHNDVGRLEHLGTWLVREAELAATRFNNVKLKADVLKQIPKEAKTGNLTGLLLLVDAAQHVRRDERDFADAVRLHSQYGKEQESIRKNLTNNPHFGLDAGHNAAFIVSVVLSVVLAVCTILIGFLKAGQQ